MNDLCYLQSHRAVRISLCTFKRSPLALALPPVMLIILGVFHLPSGVDVGDGVVVAFAVDVGAGVVVSFLYRIKVKKKRQYKNVESSQYALPIKFVYKSHLT